MWKILLWLLALAGAGGYVLLKRENPRLKLDMGRRNPPDIYDKPAGGRLYVPLRVKIDPMKTMFIFDIEDHPVYAAMELQLFDDPDKGQGANFLLSRRESRKADFYFTPGLKMDRERVSVGAGVGEWNETELDYRCEIMPNGIDAEVRMQDVDGREIHLLVKENRQDRRPPLTLLAPMGGGIDEPQFLPFFHLRGMDLVRQANTEFRLTIDGQPAHPPSLPPVPHNRASTYFARYCPDPLIALVNPQVEGDLIPVQVDGGPVHREGDTHYTLINNAGHSEIQRLEQYGDGHAVHMTFAPPLPDIASLKPGTEISGRFAIGSDDIHSVIVGDYRVQRHGEQISLTMHPTEDWWPRTGGLLAKGTFLFFPPLFRNWTQSYFWTAELRPEGDAMYIHSSWQRR